MLLPPKSTLTEPTSVLWLVYNEATGSSPQRKSAFTTATLSEHVNRESRSWWWCRLRGLSLRLYCKEFFPTGIHGMYELQCREFHSIEISKFFSVQDQKKLSIFLVLFSFHNPDVKAWWLLTNFDLADCNWFADKMVYLSWVLFFLFSPPKINN